MRTSGSRRRRRGRRSNGSRGDAALLWNMRARAGYIDTLWIFTASAPEKGATDATRIALRRVADSFAVLAD